MKTCVSISIVARQAVSTLRTGFIFLFFCFAGCQSVTTVDQVKDQTALNRYLQHLGKKIEITGTTRYPDLQKQIDRPGRVTVEMVISRNGKLLSARLKQPSGIPYLDRAIMDIITYSAPHPPLPDELAIEQLLIEKSWMFTPVK